MNEFELQMEIDDLEAEFSRRGLDPRQVYDPWPHDTQHQANLLRMLLRWVQAYEVCPNREQLEANGLMFPPVEPDFDPDSDWLRFEAWVKKQVLPATWREALQGPPTPALAELSAPALAELLEQYRTLLEDNGVEVGAWTEAPDPVFYLELLDFLEEPFELLGPDVCLQLDGCGGLCALCRRRPWCEMGVMRGEEDDEAGQMAVPADILPYVDPAKLDLDLLEG